MRSRFIECQVLVVSELENPEFSNLSIDRLAVRACFAFAAFRVDFLAYLSTLEVVDTRFPQLFQESTSLSVG